MTNPTAPPPSIPGLQQKVADLERRLLALETGGAASPSATAVPVAAAPYSGGDAARLWAGNGAVGTWSTLYHWWARMEWTVLDFRINVGMYSGNGVSGQLRIRCGEQDLWTSDAISANSTVEGLIDLRTVVDPTTGTPTGLLSGGIGSMARFTIDAFLASGSSAIYALPERLLLTGARFVR